GRVVDDAGEPCPQSRVELGSKDISEGATADERGAVAFEALPPGDYRVQVIGSGRVSERYPDVHVGTEDIEDLLWRLRAGRSIKGTVGYGTGEAAAHIEVRATQQHGGRHGWASTDREGRFEIAGLEAGEYTISAGWARLPTATVGYVLQAAGEESPPVHL